MHAKDDRLHGRHLVECSACRFLLLVNQFVQRKHVVGSLNLDLDRLDDTGHLDFARSIEPKQLTTRSEHIINNLEESRVTRLKHSLTSSLLIWSVFCFAGLGDFLDGFPERSLPSDPCLRLDQVILCKLMIDLIVELLHSLRSPLLANRVDVMKHCRDDNIKLTSDVT